MKSTEDEQDKGLFCSSGLPPPLIDVTRPHLPEVSFISQEDDDDLEDEDFETSSSEGGTHSTSGASDKD